MKRCMGLAHLFPKYIRSYSYIKICYLFTIAIHNIVVCTYSGNHQLTSVLASKSAPASVSILTTSLCPLLAAQCSGVHCFYKKIEYSVLTVM